MSDASRGLLEILMSQNDDSSALSKARYVAPLSGKIIKPPKLSKLLVDQMSDASKELLEILVTLHDEFAAIHSSQYIALKGAKVVKPQRIQATT
jgi:hypothetical protein